MNSYHQAFETFKATVYGNDRDQETFRNTTKDNNREFLESLYRMYESCEVFNIDDKMSTALLNTDCPIKYIHTPFPVIFLDSVIHLNQHLDLIGVMAYDDPERSSIFLFCLLIEKMDKSTS